MLMNLRENKLLQKAYALTKTLVDEEITSSEQTSSISSSNKKYIFIDLLELEPAFISQDEFEEILDSERSLQTQKKNGLTTYSSDELMLLEIDC